MIAKKGVAGLFYLRLYSKHPKLIEVALHGLGNMSCEAKDIIIDEGYIPKIIEVVREWYQLNYSKNVDGK